MSDLIDRQAAIDLVEEVENKRLKGEIDLTYAPMINGIMALPPAQPEIVRCKDCTYFIEDKLFGDCWCYTYGTKRVKPDDFCSRGVSRNG